MELNKTKKISNTKQKYFDSLFIDALWDRTREKIEEMKNKGEEIMEAVWVDDLVFEQRVHKGEKYWYPIGKKDKEGNIIYKK